jgi:hypothetical protein
LNCWVNGGKHHVLERAWGSATPGVLAERAVPTSYR